MTRYHFSNAKSGNGFIALMSVVIISAILLTLVFTLGVSSFFNRFDALDAENKRVSLGLAEACVNVAMINLAQDSTYSLATGGPGTCVSVGDTCPAVVGAQTSKTCKICSVVTSAGQSTINVRAVYNQTYSNIATVVTLSGNNFTITSWNESPAGPAGCIVP